MNRLRRVLRLSMKVRDAVIATVIGCAIQQSPLYAQPQPASSAGTSAVSDSSMAVPRGMARVTWARALRALHRGDTLRQGDFALSDTIIVWPWNTTPESAAEAGWLVKRPFTAGEFMHAPAVAPLPVITTGSTVKVLWQEGGVRLMLVGVATNNAALGAPVGVRIDRNRRLDGFAVGPNAVRLR